MDASEPEQMYDFKPPKPLGTGGCVKLWLKAKRWWLAGAGACLLGLAGVKGMDWYRDFRQWRVRRWIAESQKELNAGREKEAFNLLKRAYVLLPHHEETIRAVAEFETRKHDQGALGFYGQLVETGKMTLADWIAFTREAFRHGNARLAAKNLQALEAIEGAANQPEVMALNAELLGTQGKWDEATALGRQAAAAEGAPAAVKLVLARLLVQPAGAGAGDLDARQKEGLELLGMLALEPGETGLDALTALTELARMPGTIRLFSGRDVEPWLAALAAHSLVKELLKVRGWDLRLAAKPEAKQEILDRFQETYASAPLSLRLEAGRWLNQHGEPARCLQLVEKSRLESEDWFLLYLDALAGLGRWEEVKKELRSPDAVPLPMAVSRLFTWRAEMELKENPDTKLAWEDIHRRIGGEDATHQMYVAQYAQQVGYPQEAGRIYRNLVDPKKAGTLTGAPMSPAERLTCYLGALRTLPPETTTADLTELMGNMATEFPDMEEAGNDWAYLRLLTGADVEAAGAAAQERLKRQPGLLSYKTTAALAHLKQGRVQEAEEIYKGWEVDWGTAMERYRAVRIAVLEAAGKSGEAEQMRSGLKGKDLRPEERALAGLK